MTRKRRRREFAAPALLDQTDGPRGPTPRSTLIARLVAWLKTLKGVIVLIAGVGAVLGGLAGYLNAYMTARIGAQSISLLSIVGKGDAGPLSIVVLPFDNLTGDPQLVYVADGLTAAMTADLSRIRDLFIVGSATAFAYRDKPTTVQQTAMQLGVRFVLLGGVHRDSARIRVNARLIDTKSNAQLWSETFDGTLEDLFALQDLVTNRVGNSIDREMVVVTARESDARKNKPQVADLILRTRALDFKPQSLKVFEEQISLYRHVLLLDPGNAKATAGLARALSLSAFNGFVEDPVASKRQVAEACDLAVKAKDLDPSVAEVYSTLGLCAFEHGDMEGARHADERALSLEPKNPKWYSNVAIGYIWAGRPAKAIEVLSEGIRLDPRKLPGEVLGSMGLAQFYLGNDLAAIEWLLRAVDAAPDLVQPQVLLAMTYARRGDLVRARAAVEATLRMDPKFKLSQVRPGPKFPAGIRELFETIALPAGRAAGLPE